MSKTTTYSRLVIKDIPTFLADMNLFIRTNLVKSVTNVYDDPQAKKILKEYIKPKKEIKTFVDLCDTPYPILTKPWHFEITFKRLSKAANLKKWFWLPQGRLANYCICELSFNNLLDVPIIMILRGYTEDMMERDKIYQEILVSQDNGVCHRVGGE